MSSSLSNLRRCLQASVSLTLLIACSSSKDAPAAAPITAMDAASDTGATPPKPPECKNPKPVLGFDQSDTGFVLCDSNSLHRAQIHACPTRLPRTITCGSPPVDGGLNGSCYRDSDCTTKPNGFCGSNSMNATCFCQYGCTQDSDCASGSICVCGDPLGQCVPATCTSDADCHGLLCLRSHGSACGKSFACQAPTDPCTTDLDCTTPPFSACTVENGQRSCQNPGLCR